MTENDFTKAASNTGSETRAEDLRARAEELADSVKDRVEETFEEGEECVRYNPLLAVGASLLGGFLIAMIAVPRPRSWRERHIDEPLDRSQAAIVAAALAAGALFKRLVGTASSTRRHAMKDLRGYSKTAKKAMKRAGRKMHLR